MRSNWLVKFFCSILLVVTFGISGIVHAEDNEIPKFDVEVALKGKSVDEFVVTIQNISKTDASNVTIQTTIPSTLVNGGQAVTWTVDRMAKNEVREFTFKLDQKTKKYKTTTKHGKVLPQTGENKGQKIVYSLIGIVLLGIAIYFLVIKKKLGKNFLIIMLLLPTLFVFKTEPVLADSGELYNFENIVIIDEKEHVFKTAISATFLDEERKESSSKESINETEEESSEESSSDTNESSMEETVVETSESSTEESSSDTNESSMEETVVETSESSTEESSSDETNESSTEELSSETDESSPEEPIESDESESKIAITGYAYNSSNKLMTQETIKVIKNNVEITEVETDKQGYFYTHLVLDETYTLHGEKFAITIIANDLNSFNTENKQGYIDLGKTFKDEYGELTLAPSTIPLDSFDVDYELSEDSTNLQISNIIDLQIGDIVYLEPSDNYLGGIGLEIISLKNTSGIINAEVKIAELFDTISNTQGEFQDVDINSGIIIPEEGIIITEQEQINPLLRGLSTGISAGISTTFEWKEDGYSWEVTVSFDGNIDGKWNLKELTVVVNPEISASVEFSGIIKKDEDKNINNEKIQKFQKQLNLATIYIPVGITGITAKVPLSLVVSAEGNITLDVGVETSLSGEFGVEHGNIISPRPNTKFDGNLSVSGEVELKAGLQGSVSLDVLVFEAAKLDVGLGGEIDASVKFELDKATLKSGLFAYFDAKFSFPAFKGIEKLNKEFKFIDLKRKIIEWEKEIIYNPSMRELDFKNLRDTLEKANESINSPEIYENDEYYTLLKNKMDISGDLLKGISLKTLIEKIDSGKDFYDSSGNLYFNQQVDVNVMEETIRDLLNSLTKLDEPIEIPNDPDEYGFTQAFSTERVSGIIRNGQVHQIGTFYDTDSDEKQIVTSFEPHYVIDNIESVKVGASGHDSYAESFFAKSISEELYGWGSMRAYSDIVYTKPTVIDQGIEKLSLFSGLGVIIYSKNGTLYIYDNRGGLPGYELGVPLSLHNLNNVLVSNSRYDMLGDDGRFYSGLDNQGRPVVTTREERLENPSDALQTFFVNEKVDDYSSIHRRIILKNDNSLYYVGRVDRDSEDYSEETLLATNVKKVENIEDGIAFITNTDDLYVLGRNSYGVLGVGHYDRVFEPTLIMNDVKDIRFSKDKSGYTESGMSILTNSGDVYVTGVYEVPWQWYLDKNQWGEYRKPLYTAAYGVSIPQLMISGVREFASGNGNVVVKEDNSVWSWGYNNYGELGGINYLQDNSITYEDEDSKFVFPIELFTSIQ